MTPAPLVTAPPSTPEPRATHPMSGVFSAISRALTASGAPPGTRPRPNTLHGRGTGRSGRHHDGGGTSLRPPFTLPTFAPSGGREGAAGARRGRGCTGTGRCTATGAGQRRPPTAHAVAGTVGRNKESGPATPHADLVQCAQGPGVKIMQGAPRGAALLLHAPRGAPSTGASGERCTPARAIRAMGSVRDLPPPPKEGGAATTIGGGAGDYKARAPSGRSRSPRRGHGRVERADT